MYFGEKKITLLEKYELTSMCTIGTPTYVQKHRDTDRIETHYVNRFKYKQNRYVYTCNIKGV